MMGKNAFTKRKESKTLFTRIPRCVSPFSFACGVNKTPNRRLKSTFVGCESTKILFITKLGPMNALKLNWFMEAGANY